MAIISRADLCSPKKFGLARSVRASQLEKLRPEIGQVSFANLDVPMTMRGETSVFYVKRKSALLRIEVKVDIIFKKKKKKRPVTLR